MDVGFHDVTERGVDHALACDQIVATETVADDQGAEVPAGTGAGMPGVQRALIGHFQVLWRKRLAQDSFDLTGPIHVRSSSRWRAPCQERQSTAWIGC